MLRGSDMAQRTPSAAKRRRPSPADAVLAAVAAISLALAGTALWAWPVPRGALERRSAAHAVALNAADRADLELLPGVGPVLARRIRAHRRRHGPFARVEGLEAVHGIGPKTVKRVRPWVTLADR